MLKLLMLCFAILAVSTVSPTPAAERDDQSRTFDNGALRVRAAPRTPQQIAAFYIGRKFPPEMVDVLKQQCFITFGVRNQSNRIIWMDQAQWEFRAGGEIVQPLDRAFWKAKWQAMNVPLSAQSTFRWTLLPERLDFRPNEGEGGNVILPRTAKPLQLSARFLPAQGGEAIVVRFDDLRCAEDPPL